MSFSFPMTISYKVLKVINKTTVSGKKTDNIRSILQNTLDETTSELSFDLGSKTSEVYKTKKANCVGYTVFFNNLLVKKLKEKNIGNIQISHVRAKVHYLNMNLHVINSKSLKDHDISVVKNLTTGETYYVDASLSEVLGQLIIKQ